MKFSATAIIVSVCFTSTAWGLFIDNGVVGDSRLVVEPLNAGDTRLALFDPTGGLLQAGFISSYTWYADVGKDGSADGVEIGLGALSTDIVFSSLSSNSVISSGHFAGENGTIIWTARTFIPVNSVKYMTELTFDSDKPFGKLRLMDYLNADIYDFGDDELVISTGLSEGGNFSLPVTVDKELKAEVFSSFSGLSGVEYIGWSVDTSALLKSKIIDGTAVFSLNGFVNTLALSPVIDARFLNTAVFGFGDVASALAFDLDPSATSARLVTTLNFSTPEPGSLAVLGIGVIGLTVGRWRRGR